MAKKKAVEKVAKKDIDAEILSNLNKFDELQITINGELIDQMEKLQQRIDRIVDAISKSKSIKGL